MSALTPAGSRSLSASISKFGFSTRVGPFRCEGDADGERADRATLVQPLRETDLGDPARYHEAMAESAEVLRVVERRGGAGSEEQGWE